jgi:hypothetical protein
MYQFIEYEAIKLVRETLMCLHQRRSASRPPRPTRSWASLARGAIARAGSLLLRQGLS